MGDRTGAVKVVEAELSGVRSNRRGGLRGHAGVLAREESDLGVVVLEIPVAAMEPNPAQPRRVFDDQKLGRLAESIRRDGLLQEPRLRFRSTTGEPARPLVTG